LQKELEKGTKTTQVELELAQLKSQLGTGTPAPVAAVGAAPADAAPATPEGSVGAGAALPEGATAGGELGDEEEIVTAEPVEVAAPPSSSTDLFSLDQGAGS
jgi:hypothetical protein